MRMIFNFLKILKRAKNVNIFYFFILSTIFYTSFLIFYLAYDIVQSPDFEKYIQYLLFYDGQITSTGLEQGNFYFYLTYITSFLINKTIPNLTTNEILNISIHFLNSLVIIFGLIGLFKYLSLKEFNKKNIYKSLILIIFLPQLTVLRLSFKPEILAFAFLGWLFYLLEKYKNNKVEYYLFQFVFLLAILFTSKVSTALMVGLVLLIEIIFHHKYLFSKKYLKFYLLFFLCFSSLSIENYFLNDKLITQVEHDVKYDNKADFNFFTSFNSQDIIANPNRYFFSDSFVGIILLDTNGDFFKLYWDSEYTELNKERLNFFVVNDTDNYNSIPNINFDKSTSTLKISANVDDRHNDEKHENESRARLGMYLTIVFYTTILLSLFFKAKAKVLILSPLVGVLIVALSASGIFINNFDPKVGDSLKTFYYGFFVVVSVCILICKFFDKFNIPKKTITIVFLIVQMFLLGFPFNYSQDTYEDMHYKNSILPFCEFNNIFVWDIFNTERQSNCNHETFEFTIDSNKKRFDPVKNADPLIFASFFNRLPIINILFLFLIGLMAYFIRSKTKKGFYE